MRSSKELTTAFFADLKRFNNTNFNTLAKADLTKEDPVVHKAFSSVVTRYFIFKEKHPEVSEVEHKMLYFKLKIDMIASYFSEYPDAELNNLVAFQVELRRYIKESKRNEPESEEGQVDEQNAALSNIGLVTNNGLPIEQQQESVSIAI